MTDSAPRHVFSMNLITIEVDNCAVVHEELQGEGGPAGVAPIGEFVPEVEGRRAQRELGVEIAGRVPIGGGCGKRGQGAVSQSSD